MFNTAITVAQHRDVECWLFDRECQPAAGVGCVATGGQECQAGGETAALSKCEWHAAPIGYNRQKISNCCRPNFIIDEAWCPHAGDAPVEYINFCTITAPR